MRLKFLTLYSSIAFVPLVVLGVLLPYKTNAASVSTDLSVNVAPSNPAPGENTTITLSSYVDNLDSVQISWSVNGKSSGSGIGKKTFSLNAPIAGSETSVVATVALPDGAVDTKIIIRPSVMVLLWQADDSYVPPFYKGKAMPSPSSEVKVVAMPEIKNGSKTIDPNSMLYVWQEDYNNQQDASGYGKNSFIYTNDYLDDSNNISVTASTLDQKYSSQASINVGVAQPKIVFYKNDAVLGTIWGQALADGHKIISDETIVASPYFVSPADIRIPTLAWSWFINDGLVNILNSQKNFLPVKVQAGVSGTSKIRLELSNREKIFERANKEITVEF